MASPGFSAYYYSLNEASQMRYREKLSKLGGLKDPYLGEQEGVIEDPWDKWPEVQYPDIFCYLIETTSEYTGETLKAYKSLDSYNYFINGWVANVKAIAVPGSESHLVMGSVRHSQRLAVPPATPWVVARKEGTIQCAHCTCMAGLGEACSHIAALLFMLESNTHHKRMLSCTSLPCSWLPPSFQNVEYAEIASIDFETPQLKRKKSNITDCVNTSYTNVTSPVQSPSPQEVDKLYKDLSNKGKHAILSVVPGYCDAYKPLHYKGILPEPLEYLFHIDNLNLPYHLLLEKCEAIYDDYKVTLVLVKNVEIYTKGQTQSKIWFQQRAGRVTASRLKAVVCTDKTQPSKSLLQAICYPESTKFTSKATTWGCEHEQVAFDSYKRKGMNKHVNFSLSNSGLVINCNYPFFGASPDGIIKCHCCGDGVLEIKCPYSCHDKSFLTKSNESNFFLNNADGLLSLDVYHCYYFQVQAQLKICSASYYSDFVVWQENDFFVQRIYLDEPFITIAFIKATELIKTGILPELVGKWFTKEPTVVSAHPSSYSSDIVTMEGSSERLWCYCRKTESGKMICCDNNDCPIEWFHTTCLKMKRVPKGKWFCPSCHRKGKKT